MGGEEPPAFMDTAQATPQRDTRSTTLGVNIRTLRDLREPREDQQFYTINQLNLTSSIVITDDEG